jgi:hypothetical protein
MCVYRCPTHQTVVKLKAMTEFLSHGFQDSYCLSGHLGANAIT